MRFFPLVKSVKCCANVHTAQNLRNFSLFGVLRSTDLPSNKPENSAGPSVANLSAKKHRVNDLEKRLLVWSGKYKRIEEVPELVSQESVEKARNKGRIRLANVMIVATLAGCLVMVLAGKDAAKRGDSVQKANLEWHKRMGTEPEKTSSQ